MVTQRKRDSKGIYREFQGEKYRYWEKRRYYVSQVGGRQRLLHRQLWEYHNGKIPEKHRIQPKDKSWDNFDPDNWECTNKHPNPAYKHPRVLFNGKYYYKQAGRPYYFYTHPEGKKTSLHRAVYTHHKGEIPEGFAVHHIDHNSQNNAPENLCAMPRGEHTAHHRKEQGFTPAMRAGLEKAQLAARAWHSTPEGLKWHSENGKACWKNRKQYVKSCVQCGKQYETYYPTRAKYCHGNCKAANLRQRRRVAEGL